MGAIPGTTGKEPPKRWRIQEIENWWKHQYGCKNDKRHKSVGVWAGEGLPIPAAYPSTMDGRWWWRWWWWTRRVMKHDSLKCHRSRRRLRLLSLSLMVRSVSCIRCCISLERMSFVDISLPWKILRVFWVLLRIFIIVAMLYFFICSLDVLQNSFQLLAGINQ